MRSIKAWCSAVASTASSRSKPPRPAVNCWCEHGCRFKASGAGGMRQTLYDKIWRDHVVDETPDGTCLLYVDRHLVHEVDSPQAFGGLRRAGLPVKSPGRTLL